jgi:hypothetical protein
LPKYVGTSAEAPNRRRIAWTKELEYEKNWISGGRNQ